VLTVVRVVIGAEFPSPPPTKPLSISKSAVDNAMLCYATCALLCVLRYALLCYAVLCYAMLCFAMLRYLCYAMLCYAMVRYAMLCYAMLCYAMLCYAQLATETFPRSRLARCPCNVLGGFRKMFPTVGTPGPSQAGSRQYKLKSTKTTPSEKVNGYC